MSRYMRAVVTEWKGSTRIFIETEQAVLLIQQLLRMGLPEGTEEDWYVRDDDSEMVTIVMRELAADRFLALLESNEDEMWGAITDSIRAIPNDELDLAPDDDALAALVGNWRNCAAEWREAINDGELVLKLDYT
jgi:hypothetical protein